MKLLDQETNPRMKVDGIGRDPENDRVVFLSLSRRPSDDEMRAIQDTLNGRMA